PISVNSFGDLSRGLSGMCSCAARFVSSPYDALFEPWTTKPSSARHSLACTLQPVAAAATSISRAAAAAWRTAVHPSFVLVEPPVICLLKLERISELESA